MKPEIEGALVNIRKSGVTDKQRLEIRSELDALAKRLMSSAGLSGEAIALEIRYWHQSASNPYRTNSTSSDKNKSYKVHEGKCGFCSKKIESFDEAVFHHIERGIADQHGPENLVPYHNECHDNHHHAGKQAASMTKGSQKK